MAGFTGVGEAMENVQDAYEGVNWALFDPNIAVMRGRKLGVEAFDAAFALAKGEYPKVVALRQKVYALRDRAQEAEARYRENPLIPASSRELAGDIARVAEHFAVELRSMDRIWDQHREALVRQLAGWRRDINGLLKTVEQQALTVSLLPNPTAEQLYGAVQQKCASLYINIRSQPDLRPQLMNDWQRVTQKSWYEAPDGQAVREKIRELRNLAARTLTMLVMAQ
jgi:hypothetical protein